MTGETPLWRQVNPHWIRAGRVSSQAFRPTKKDANRLSVDNGDMISAQEAYRSFSARFESAGVLGVLVAECEAQDLQVVTDGLEGRPAHTAIDFGGLSVSGTRKAAERLRDHAVRRGWQVQPPLAP